MKYLALALLCVTVGWPAAVHPWAWSPGPYMVSVFVEGFLVAATVIAFVEAVDRR